MNIEKLKAPYNDGKLKFNELTNHYELTLAYVKENFDVNFKDDGVLQKRITLNSRVVYNYLFFRTHTNNKEVVEFMLNKTENGRKFLLDLLHEQMSADLQTGFNDMGNLPSINMATGQVIDRELIMQNMVSVNTEMIADRSEQYCGFNLLYQSTFPFYLFALIRG